MDIKGYARYALRYWLTDLAVDDPTDAALRWHILTALHRADIHLAVEESSVHVTKENEKYEEAVHQREISLRIKTLRKVELFGQMTDDELRKIAERLRYSPFARGNVITKQGDDRSHWLYIIVSGYAEVYLEMPDGGRRVLSTLQQGHFFGEMGLMTGAPRAASVVAKTDVECYRLDKDVFEEIIHERPSIADEITHLLVNRQAELDSAKLDINRAVIQKDDSQRHNEILSTIKRFFSLSP
jgi:CRP-like cAMP-binding protein